MSSKKILLDLNQLRGKVFGCVNSILNRSYGNMYKTAVITHDKGKMQ